MANNIDVALRAKDEASKTFQNASARLRELRAEIDQLRAKGNVNLTVGDTGRINQLTRQANQLERALQGAGTAGSVAADQMASSFGGLQNVLSGLGLGSLGAVLGGAGIAAAVGTVGRLAIEMGGLGEQVQRSETYFRTFSGSAGQAAANLQAVQRATEGALSSQEAMQAATKLLSMGLATTADDLSKISRMAVLLGGDTRTASDAINEFSLLLANQSILRLDTFGISGARVRERIEELQAATAGLSREQAFMDAVMEEGTRKVNDLEAAGVTAGTSMDRLRGSTADLKAALAELVAQPYTVTVNMVTSGVQDLTNLLEGGKRDALILDVDAGVQERIAAIEASIQQLEETKQRFNDGSPLSIFKRGLADQDINTLRTYAAQLRVYGSATDEVRGKLDTYLDASLRLSEAQTEVNSVSSRASPVVKALAQAELEAAQAARDSALAAYQAAAGYATQANEADLTRERLLGLAAANREVAAAAAEAAVPRVAGYDNSGRERQGWAYMQQPERDAEEYFRLYNNKKRTEEERAAAESLRLAQKTAKASASAWDSEFQRASGRIAGYLSQGMSSAEGLFDLTPDLFAPGSNGAFENLFRTLDVAKLGDASPWAKQLGLTQEEAKKIGADFQRGIFSESVIGLIDVNALINEAQMAQLAEQSKTAFANAIAQKAGVGTNVVSALFGLGGGATGPGQGGQARTLTDSAMAQVAGVLGESVEAAEFAGRVTGYGEMIWGYFETGIVGKAENSTALRRAIDAMVSAAISGQTGGSVGDAVRSGGGQ